MIITGPDARPLFAFPHFPLRGPDRTVHHSVTSSSLNRSGTPAQKTALFVVSSVLNIITGISCNTRYAKQNLTSTTRFFYFLRRKHGYTFFSMICETASLKAAESRPTSSWTMQKVFSSFAADSAASVATLTAFPRFCSVFSF